MDKNNIIKEADELLNKIKSTNADFKEKTDNIIANINNKIDSTEKDFKATEKELKKFEKNTVDEIDKAVLDFVS
ncbi:hypothetical protein HON59_02270 [bacterium]|jgi:ElaB/YqjD/DUF883 family membrane-anchored ribosome-binding protein|nr:hypothetical protein [bacterium]MBT4894867.1 hypothetical protein [bacterium]